MNTKTSRLGMDAPVVYRITVRGALDSRWRDAFGGLGMEVDTDGEVAVTSLAGPVSDQAALQGVLRQLYDLGLPLISVSLAEGSDDMEDRR